MNDYKERKYLSSIEVAKYLGITVKQVYSLVRKGILKYSKSTSGQYRFNLQNIKIIENNINKNNLFTSLNNSNIKIKEKEEININETNQVIYIKDSREMKELKDNSIHLVITSPPYFNAKLYSNEFMENDLGNIHDLNKWLIEIGKVRKEVFRVLQPGRKLFINIMNLPIRTKNGFKSLNLVGKTIDLCENIGFIFKREIIWHKTNSVRAHFGTYPYPGGILINYSHEFILELEKPTPSNYRKYSHLTKEQKESSKLDKEFWIQIKKSDVWLIKPEKSGVSRNHPAPFPYELPYRLIKAYSYVGETILDPFVGSGTTLIATRNLKRNGIGYEINPIFATEAIERLRKII